MNKYQIAWEHIKTLKGSNLGYYGNFTQSFLAFEEDEKIIEEIVQKTIPKKIELFRIKKYDGYNIGKCSCGAILDTSMNDDIDYCQKCGQRIDWSNESE